MKNIITIFNKELMGYLKSPMAYIVAASFFTITGFFFVASVSDAFSEASIRGFLAGAVFFMIFLSPALTMRLIAEEQKLGTMELLMTSPLKDFEIVLGKLHLLDSEGNQSLYQVGYFDIHLKIARN